MKYMVIASSQDDGNILWAIGSQTIENALEHYDAVKKDFMHTEGTYITLIDQSTNKVIAIAEGGMG